MAEAGAEPGTPRDSAAGYRRWLIVGSAGAGKSVLAREMAELLGLPIIHLDRHNWNPGWVATDRKEWTQKVVELISRDTWVMDGNYGGSISLRLPRAEAVVLLDLPVWQCLWGIFRRSTLYRKEPRPDLPEGCEEQLPDWAFIGFVLTYKWRSLPKVLRKIAGEPHVRLYHLKSRGAARRFMDELRDAVKVETAGEGPSNRPR